MLSGRLPRRFSGSDRPDQAQKPSDAAIRASAVGTGTDERSQWETAARARSTRPEQLRRQLSGDLDNIVQKALEVAPEQRYGSIQELSEDLQRHLDGRPVQARGDSWSYRAGKFTRRHIWGLTAAGVALATLMSFSIFTGDAISPRLALKPCSWRRRRDRATLELGKAQEVADFMVSLFQASEPDRALGGRIDSPSVA